MATEAGRWPVMRVYLAAPYAARDLLRSHATELRRVGFTVTSSWLDEEHAIDTGTTGAATALDDDQVSGHAVTDLRDIERSDLLVLFTTRVLGIPSSAGASGGRHVETGYALARCLPVVVVGEPENVFHRLQAKPVVHGWDVQVVPDWHRAVLELVARREALPQPADKPCGCVR